MEVFGKVPFTGDFRVRLTERLSDFVEYLLPDMDRHGVDMQVLSLTAPGVQADLRPADALDIARLANDHLASVIGRVGHRLVPLGAGRPERRVGCRA